MQSLTLRNIPEDVNEFLLDLQHEKKKEKKVGKFGIESTIYAALRDYKRCRQNEQKSLKQAS